MRGFIKQYANGVFAPEVISILEDAFAEQRATQCDEQADRARDLDARHYLKSAADSWRDIAKHYLRLAGEYHLTD